MSAWDVLYWYKMTVNKIYDADSITDATLDQGFKRLEEDCRVRLDQIDTPEMYGKTDLERAMARAARGYLVEQMPVGSRILVHSQKIRKRSADQENLDGRGRILGWVYTNKDGFLDDWNVSQNGMPDRAFSLNTLLLSMKLACPYDGKGARPARGNPEFWPNWHKQYESEWAPILERHAA